MSLYANSAPASPYTPTSFQASKQLQKAEVNDQNAKAGKPGNDVGLH